MTGLVIDIVLMLTMAGLLGVVLVLHFKLKDFGRDALRVPALADDLTKAITTSRTVMQELAKSARTDGAHLEELTSRAARHTQELTYILDRAEKVLERFDTHLSSGAMRLAPAAIETTQQPAAAQQPVAPKAPTATPTATPTTAQRPMTSANSQAAIMPGRYKKEMATPQATEKVADKPFKPASFGSTAAAYSSANSMASGKAETTDTNDAPPVASEAERELRRALGGSV